MNVYIHPPNREQGKGRIISSVANKQLRTLSTSKLTDDHVIYKYGIVVIRGIIRP